MNPWRAVKVMTDACRITRRLDDRVRGGSTRALDASSLQEQSEIDAALADRRATPWRSPASSLRIDVMTAIEARRNGRLRRRADSGRSRPARWALAAAVAVAAGVAAFDSLEREVASPSRPAALDPGEQAIELAMGFAFDVRPVLAERMDEPLKREAMALQEDTSRAARVLMDGLTLESDASPR